MSARCAIAPERTVRVLQRKTTSVLLFLACHATERESAMQHTDKPAQARNIDVLIFFFFFFFFLVFFCLCACFVLLLCCVHAHVHACLCVLICVRFCCVVHVLAVVHAGAGGGARHAIDWRVCVCVYVFVLLRVY